MRKFSLILAAALAVTGAMVGGRAQAAVAINPSALRVTADDLVGLQKVQFFWGGHQYCWYDGGWRGPGWYWCGYSWRRGFGWGGPVGWRGWRRPAIRPGRRFNRPGRPGRPGFNRPGRGRPGAGRPGRGRPGGGGGGGRRGRR